MDFLCDAIAMKQSMESTLKVQEKSLTTVLDEVHFIVNLYNFPLLMVPQANPFQSHLPRTPKLSPLFLLTIFLGGYLISKVRINKMVNSLDYHLSLTTTLKDQPQGYILLHFYKLSRVLSLFLKCLLNFLSKFYIPPCVGKLFKFVEFTLLENPLILLMLISLKTHPQVFVITSQTEGNYSFPHSAFF